MNILRGQDIYQLRADTFDKPARELACMLIGEGLAPFQKIENHESRSLIVWGFLRVDYSCSSGKVSVGLIEKGLSNSEWRMLWQVSVAGYGMDFNRVLDEFCEWSVKKHLKAYGPSTILAAGAMKEELARHCNVRNNYCEWRQLYNRWLLPVEVSTLAHRTYGPAFSTEDFNRISENLSVVKQVYSTSPNLLPVLGWILNQRTPLIEQQLFGRSVTVKEFFDGFRKALISRLQNSVDGASFSPGAWRFLAKQPPAVVRSIVRPDLPGLPGMFSTLALLAGTGESPIPRPLMDHLYSYIERYLNPGMDSNGISRYLRLLILELRNAQRGEAVFAEVLNQAIQISDWLVLLGYSEGFPLRNSNWASLLRKQQEWHDMAGWNLGLSDDDVPDTFWGSALDHLDIDGCNIRSLNSSQELISEGREMHHCVSTYRQDCERGVSKIFSIQSNDGRSTLELRQSEGVWDISQHRGVWNSSPPIAHQRVAVKLLYEYQDAAREECGIC